MGRRRKSFLLRHTLTSTALLLALVITGTMVAAPIASRFPIFKPDLNGHPVKAIAEALEGARGSRPVEEIVRGIKSDFDSASGDFFIADQNGAILAKSGGADPVVDSRYLPTEPHIVSALNERTPDPGEAAVVRLAGDPIRFLIFRPKIRVGPEQFILGSIAILLTFLVGLAMAASSYFLLRKLRRHAVQAQETMESLKRGNLKARLPVAEPDEFGTMMDLFNQMASEIENLFIRVREAEAMRVHLLQDIGHDLRTPLGSLRNIFDLLNEKFDLLAEAEKRDLIKSGKTEVMFTLRLVEDLLFLARVEDPSCRKQDEELDLSALIHTEVEAKRAATSLEILCSTHTQVYALTDPHLIKRLLRNALDNSISFASERILVRLESEDGIAKIHIEDDGPGFSEAAIASYGQKRPTRIQHSDSSSRISMGLGSVIMVAIARLYGGSAVPSNIVTGNKVSGGRVSISLSIAASKSIDRKAS